MNALCLAKQERATIVAEQRIREALNSQLSAAASMFIAPGDRVRVVRESDNPLDRP